MTFHFNLLHILKCNQFSFFLETVVIMATIVTPSTTETPSTATTRPSTSRTAASAATLS